MTATTPIPTAAEIHQASSISISVQYREAGSEEPAGHLSAPWKQFTQAFQKPHWHGKESLATYCEHYDDFFKCEVIPARQWQPTSFKTNGTDSIDIPYVDKVLLHAVVFNLENGTSSDEIRRQLHGLTGLVHSTYRHSPTAPRWRVILPLRNAVEPADWQAMRDALMHRFNALLDETYKSRPWDWYRLPACPPDTKEHYTMFQLDGHPLRMTPEFQAECTRSQRLKLQANSNKDVTPVNTKIGAEPPSATTAPQASDTHQVQDTTSTVLPSPASATAAEKNTDNDPEISVSVVAAPSAPRHISHEDLMAELEALAQEYLKPDDYLRIRERYCEASMALNVHGLWAPAFRPDIPIPKKKSLRQPPHELIQQDRVVIDCHWLHCRQYHIAPAEAQWRPLFKKNSEFPLALAQEFATRNITNEYRAEAILRLTHPLQVQLRALRGRTAQEQFGDLTGYSRVDGKRVPPPLETIALAINRWAEKERRVASHREKYMAHAMARELLKPASPTRKEIAALVGLIRGVPALSERTAYDLLKKIDKQLAKLA